MVPNLTETLRLRLRQLEINRALRNLVTNTLLLALSGVAFAEHAFSVRSASPVVAATGQDAPDAGIKSSSVSMCPASGTGVRPLVLHLTGPLHLTETLLSRKPLKHLFRRIVRSLSMHARSRRVHRRILLRLHPEPCLGRRPDGLLRSYGLCVILRHIN